VSRRNSISDLDDVPEFVVEINKKKLRSSESYSMAGFVFVMVGLVHGASWQHIFNCESAAKVEIEPTMTCEE